MKFSTLTALFLLSVSSLASAQQAKKFYLFPNVGLQTGFAGSTVIAYKYTGIERQSISADLGYYPFKKLGFYGQLGISPSHINMQNQRSSVWTTENAVLLLSQVYASYTYLQAGNRLKFYVNGGVQFNYRLSKDESHYDFNSTTGPVDADVYGYKALTTYLTAETGARFIFGTGNFLSLGVNYAHGLNNVFQRGYSSNMQYVGVRGGFAFRIFR